LSKLYVDEIQPKTTGGIITFNPNRPAWSCYLGNEQTSQNLTTTRPLPFDTKEFDIGNNLTVDTTNGGVFTAPVSGIYQFNAMVQYSAAEASAYNNLYMFVDGAMVGGGLDLSYRYIEDPQGGNYQTSNISSIIQLTLGQTLTPNIQISTDTSVNIRIGARFNGFLIG